MQKGVIDNDLTIRGLLQVAHCVIHGEALPPPLLGVLELLE